ncbi:MAG: glycosyltransferase family 39 protein [Candidatus Aminicenantes bacterium]|nr:glycosyltransferase family 39 protein [Candidatus Aminicenantes bacterium]
MKKIPDKLYKSWRLWILLGSAIGIRIYIFIKMHPVVHTDSITFLFLNELDMVRTPGYPLFNEILFAFNDLFSITTDYFRLICFGQMFILGVISAFLIYRITEKLTTSWNFALLMGIVYNFNFFVIGFEFQIMTETLSITLLLAVLLLYIELFNGKKGVAAVGGILAVLLLYTRATFLLLGLGLPILTLIVYLPFSKRRDFRKNYAWGLILFVLINIAGIGAWTLRNRIKFDYSGISSLMPYQLRYYTNSMFEKYKPSGDRLQDEVARIYLEEFRKSAYSSATVFRFHQRSSQELGLSEAEISREFMKINMKLIRDYPWDYLKQVSSSLVSYYRQYSPYWTTGNAKKFLNTSGLIPAIFRTVYLLYQTFFMNPVLLIIMVVAAPLYLLIRTFREKKLFHGWLVLWAAVQYNCFVSILSTNAGINNLRYRQPVEPLILLMFFAALYVLGKGIVHKCFFLPKSNNKHL